MITKAELQSIRALRNRPDRESTGRFVVEGWKGVMELLASDLDVLRIYAQSEINPPPGFFLPDSATRVSKKDMERMSQMKTPPGILAVVAIPTPEVLPVSSADLSGTNIPVIVVCDGITDPGNLGTIIRTADWFGFAGVVCDRRGVDPWNSKCLQASMGSAFRMPIWSIDTADWLANWKGACWALDGGGAPLSAVQWEAGALVVGSESHGLSDHIRSSACQITAIPGAGRAESLNAAVACSIAMHAVAHALTAS